MVSLIGDCEKQKVKRVERNCGIMGYKRFERKRFGKAGTSKKRVKTRNWASNGRNFAPFLM